MGNTTPNVRFEFECPKCQSKNLDYGVMEPEDEMIKQPVKCNECGHEFEIFAIPEWHVRQ